MKLILALTISDVHKFVLCGASKKRECESIVVSSWYVLSRLSYEDVIQIESDSKQFNAAIVVSSRQPD